MTRSRWAGTIVLAMLAYACSPASRAATSGPSTRRTATAVSLQIVSYNIRHGRGADDALDLERTASVLRTLRADVIGLQEVDERVERSGRVDEAAALGAALGFRHAFGSFMDYQGGRYGLAILSRHPITGSRAVRLPDGNEPRVALAAQVELPGGRPLMVINVHFDWVDDDAFRFAQARALTAFIDSLTMPYVLLGDFNDQPGSRTLELFQQRAIELRKPAGERFTFPSSLPIKEIDFVFVAPAAAWRAGEAWVVEEKLASDHRPVAATATLLGSADRRP